MEKLHRQHLAEQFSRGRTVLFTGAGFAIGASNRRGSPVPSVSELRSKIWDLIYPDEPVDSSAALGDVFEVALKTRSNDLRRLMTDELTVEPRSLDASYKSWLSMPWERVYTLNVDDLLEAAGSVLKLPRPVRTISAITDTLPLPSREMHVVHLNGTIKGFPNVTFSERQYGERLAVPDPWYPHLIGDLRDKSVVFVGTTLGESPLWRSIALRGPRTAAKELRPRSYLVTPELSRPRADLLTEWNVVWIPMTRQEFATEILDRMKTERERGLEALDQRGAPARERVIISLADARSVRPDDLSLFLMGREPLPPDLTDGFAIEREFEVAAKETIDAAGVPVVLVTGTAGSGKSTSLLRLGLLYEADGRDVWLLDVETGMSLQQIRQAIAARNPEVLLVDDVDVFGESTGSFLRGVHIDNKNTLILSALRSVRYESLRVPEDLQDLDFERIVVPNLADSDIDRLLDSLERANRLGRLKDMSRTAQRQIFQGLADRQLLVAMIEATTGERFEEMVRDECRELPPDLAAPYAVIALATSFRHYVTKNEVLLAIGETTNAGLNRVQQLANAHLIRGRQRDQLRVRHRHIADRVIDYFREVGQLGHAVSGLLFALATQVSEALSRNSRIRDMLRSLLNHDLMIRLSAGGEMWPRQAYDQVEELLASDPHFWLQRGRFETEVGDSRLAQNFLNQARAMAPDDPNVKTAWAAITIKRAAAEPMAQGAAALVEEAIGELDDAMEKRGHRDVHPYHVLGSQGLSWVRRAPLGNEGRSQFLRSLLMRVRVGQKLHPKSPELDQLAFDLQREVLMLAVADGEEHDSKP